METTAGLCGSSSSSPAQTVHMCSLHRLNPGERVRQRKMHRPHHRSPGSFGKDEAGTAYSAPCQRRAARGSVASR